MGLHTGTPTPAAEGRRSTTSVQPSTGRWTPSPRSPPRSRSRSNCTG
jgi:hypothetical protein